jgi:hypothetical protein
VWTDSAALPAFTRFTKEEPRLMAAIASALKAEIARVARKEIRTETGSMKKAISSFRSEIAALKKRRRQVRLSHILDAGSLDPPGAHCRILEESTAKK